MYVETRSRTRHRAVTARVLKFPTKAIRVIRDGSGAWLVLAGSNGWLHGDHAAAMAENYGRPIRNIASNGVS